MFGNNLSKFTVYGNPSLNNNLLLMASAACWDLDELIKLLTPKTVEGLLGFGLTESDFISEIDRNIVWIQTKDGKDHKFVWRLPVNWEKVTPSVGPFAPIEGDCLDVACQLENFTLVENILRASPEYLITLAHTNFEPWDYLVFHTADGETTFVELNWGDNFSLAPFTGNPEDVDDCFKRSWHNAQKIASNKDEGY